MSINATKYNSQPESVVVLCVYTLLYYKGLDMARILDRGLPY